MSDITIQIASVAGTRSVNVPEGTSLDEALRIAEANESGLGVAVNGDPSVESADVNLANGDVVSLTPQNVKLGL
jgi:sulfur carrier protein ThiS